MHLSLGTTRLSSIVSQPIKVVVDVIVVIFVFMAVIDHRNLPLKFGQNWVINN